jgi:metal-responsive CopG/Arc/MetJ family transcriptional regulator
MGVAKMTERITPQIAITMNGETLKEIDRLSKKLGINRSRLISNIVELGVCYVKLLEKVGLIDLAKSVRDFQGLLRKELRVA